MVPESLYIHIPFCRKACSYCNFHFSTSLQDSRHILRALIEELALRMNPMSRGIQGLNRTHLNIQSQERFPLRTLYIGGGTPSLLSGEELSYLVDGIGRWFDLGDVEEFTLEANPEDVEPAQVELWRGLGMNRISLGIQSFDDRNLRRMNRAHNASKAREAVTILQNEGFQSLSADLIYGFPEQTLSDFEADLQELLQFGLSHFSAYQLTCEPKTALFHHVQQQKVRMIPEELVLEQMMHLYQVAERHGYRAYEISSFAQPGHEAVHNSRYWSGHAYWGLGPSAHSYDGNRKRSWNISNNTRYQREIQSNKLPVTVEELSDDQIFNEAILVGLRLADGLSWTALEQMYGYTKVQKLRAKVASMPIDWFEDLNLADRVGYLRLSLAGRVIADHITLELFVDSNI
jgi:oxygen-independent coproporphyrinogen-3 oxidase